MLMESDMVLGETFVEPDETETLYSFDSNISLYFPNFHNGTNNVRRNGL